MANDIFWKKEWDDGENGESEQIFERDSDAKLEFYGDGKKFLRRKNLWQSAPLSLTFPAQCHD